MTNAIQVRDGNNDNETVRHFNRIMRRRILDGAKVVFLMDEDHSIRTFTVKQVQGDPEGNGSGGYAIITSHQSGEDYATIFADGLAGMNTLSTATYQVRKNRQKRHATITMARRSTRYGQR